MEKVLGNLNKKIVYLIVFVCFNLINCQEKKTNKNNLPSSKTNQISGSEFESIFARQIKNGAASEYGSYDDYSEKDLNALISFEDSLLQSNGYKVLEINVFSDRIKKIFGRVVDYSSQSKYLSIDTFEPCNKNLFYKALSADNQNLYVSKSSRILTYFYPLPLVINYQRMYPKFSEYEKIPTHIETNDGTQIIKQWKDLPNLLQDQKMNSQFIIALNMYLFNDSKPHFKWLILNNEYFMESLVKTFGYTQDAELLKWAIEKTKFDKNNPQDYGKLFWTKQCDGTVKLHANTFKMLQKLYLPNDSSENQFILDNIKDYIEYLGDSNTKEDITESDRVKIMANLAYFAEQYKYDSRYNDGSKMMGRLRYFFNDEDLKILQSNNYFSMPKFKEWWNNADYDQYYVDGEYNGEWGSINQPLSYDEWRKQHPKK